MRSCAFHRPIWPWWDWREHEVEDDLESWTTWCEKCGLGEPMINWVIDEWDAYPDIWDDHPNDCDGMHSPERCPAEAFYGETR